jgi:RNA polymerase sigma factor (sigma-70 family)
MSDEHTGETTLIPLFDRLAAGDTSAADDIIDHAMERLKLLAHKRMKSFPAVRQRHETVDVVQGAAMRLYRALKAVRPTSVEQFLRLAATQIRRELLDLKRHEFGVNEDRVQVVFGPGGSTSEANHILDGPAKDAKEKEKRRQRQEEIDELVEHLPKEERGVFEQIVYQGLAHKDVAHALGISESTVKRRWYDAQETLHRLLSAE